MNPNLPIKTDRIIGRNLFQKYLFKIYDRFFILKILTNSDEQTRSINTSIPQSFTVPPRYEAIISFLQSASKALFI